MTDEITLDEAIAAVERAARGIRTADARKQARDLFAAVGHLRRLRDITMPATAALDRRMADETRIAAARGQARDLMGAAAHLLRNVTDDERSDAERMLNEMARNATHGSAALDADAAKLEAMGADPGPTTADLMLDEMDEEARRAAEDDAWLKSVL